VTGFFAVTVGEQAWSLARGVALAAASTPVWLEASLLGECQSWTEKALANIEASQRSTRDEMVLQSARGFSMMFTKGMTSEAYAALTRAAELAGSLHDPDYHLLALNSLHRPPNARPAGHARARRARSSRDSC
jgi:hypothetical protein